MDFIAYADWDCFRILPNVEICTFDCDCGAETMGVFICWGAWSAGVTFCTG